MRYKVCNKNILYDSEKYLGERKNYLRANKNYLRARADCDVG